MSTPDFSVIIVNWNTKDLVLEALDSVERDADESGTTVETIVVDNGSEDDSVRAIHSGFPNTLVIENRRNLGFARAVNRGLRLAQGDHIVLLNSDARLVPGALQGFADVFDTDPRIGIAGGVLLDPDGGVQNSIAPFPTLLTELANKSLLRWLFPGRYRRKVSPEETNPLEVDSVIGACLVIRGETLKEIGSLDERFFFFFEETDWCLRARRSGWKVIVQPKARIFHGQGVSSRPVLADSRIEFYRSRYRYFMKNHGKLQTAVLFEAMLLKLTVQAMLRGLWAGLRLGRSETANQRFGVAGTLWAWHVRGCPNTWGLEARFLGSH